MKGVKDETKFMDGFSSGNNRTWVGTDVARRQLGCSDALV